MLNLAHSIYHRMQYRASYKRCEQYLATQGGGPGNKMAPYRGLQCLGLPDSGLSVHSLVGGLQYGGLQCGGIQFLSLPDSDLSVHSLVGTYSMGAYSASLQYGGLQFFDLPDLDLSAHSLILRNNMQDLTLVPRCLGKHSNAQSQRG